MQTNKALLALIIAVGATGVINAATLAIGTQIGVDIGTAAGTTANWTTITAYDNTYADGHTGNQINALNLADGSTLSGITVNLAAYSAASDIAWATPTGNIGGGGFNTLSGNGTAMTDFPVEVYGDGAWVNGGSGYNVMQLTFYGLDTTKTYTLELLSRASGTTNLTDAIYVNGVQQNLGALNTKGARLASTAPLVFTDLTADASGNLTISYYNNNNPVMNGARLTVVPEPSTYAFAGVGSVLALGLVVLRRRKTR